MKPENIYINGRFLTQSLTGVQRYAAEICKGFDNMLDNSRIDPVNFRITIIAPQQNIEKIELKHIEIFRAGRFSGHLWEQMELPSLARNGILFSPCNAGPIRHKNHIVIMHDTSYMAYPETFSFGFRNWYRIMQYRLCQNAKRIVTVSEFSKSELCKHFNCPVDSIETIYHGYEHSLYYTDSSILNQHDLKPQSYILGVGSLNKRKNFEAALKAMKYVSSNDIILAVAGDANPKVFGAKKIEFDSDVIWLGRVSDSELSTLYKNATAFVYPSIYEGFGLPPLEAMAHGCPVIVSDIPPHHEVCGEAALYFDPHDHQILAKHINSVISDQDLRSSLAAKSKERSGLFSWQKCSEKTWNVIIN